MREIEAGAFKREERLATEEQLGARFRVSRITIGQALQELSSLGFIRREQGRGTFVQPRALEQGPRGDRYTIVLDLVKRSAGR